MTQVPTGQVRGRPLAVTVGATVAAATIGNSLVSKEDLAWLSTRRRPAMQIPLPVFAAVGVVYYVILGVVLYRACDRRDGRATRLALVVLVLNEAWNVAFFKGRSTRNGFAGLVLFLVPLCGLQLSVRHDRTSALVLAPYTAWAVLYDLPWTFRLWSLDRSEVDDVEGTD